MMRTTNRFGWFTSDEYDDDDAHTVCQRFYSRKRIIVGTLSTLIFFLFLSQLSLFDYHRLLAPRPGEVAVRCATSVIRNESDIKEAELIYGHSVHLMVHVYTISITRSVECHWLEREEDPLFTLHYRDDYLNVSQIDVAQLTRVLEDRHPLKIPFLAWYYGEYDTGYWHARLHTLDRQGLALEPIDPYEEGYLMPYMAMKFSTLSLSVTLSVLWLWLLFLCRHRSVNQA